MCCFTFIENIYLASFERIIKYLLLSETKIIFEWGQIYIFEFILKSVILV